VDDSAAGWDGGPVSHLDSTNDVTTAMIVSGIVATPPLPRKRVVSSTAVIGSCSIPAVIAPIPMAAPAISGRPGRCDSAIPPAAPMNIQGKTGPPRKPASEMEYASALHTTSRTSAPAV
jgi:hypothetical protein